MGAAQKIEEVGDDNTNLVSIVGADKSVVKRKNNRKNNNDDYFDKSLFDTAIYDGELYSRICKGIAQNILIEMDKQGIKLTQLTKLACIDVSTLSKILSGKSNLSLYSLVKISLVLNIQPGDLFPFEAGTKKTNGQRFDEITKSLDVRSVNYLLDQAAGLSKLMLRL